MTKWQWLAVLTFTLCCASAQAPPPPGTQKLAEKESLAQRRRKAARRVLATYESHSLAVGRDGSLWVWGQGPGTLVGSWPEISDVQAWKWPTARPAVLEGDDMRAVFVLLWLLAGSALAQESASSVGAEEHRKNEGPFAGWGPGPSGVGGLLPGASRAVGRAGVPALQALEAHLCSAWPQQREAAASWGCLAPAAESG